MKRFLIVFLLLMLLMLQYKLWVDKKGFVQRSQLLEEIKQQTQTNQQLKARNDVIGEEIQALSSGNDALEELARSKLNMIADDEKFIVIKKDQN